jgi:hypothetical protein
VYVILNSDMTSKKEERKFYDTVYLLAFGRESLYFHQNDTVTIFNFLKEVFWGEGLQYRIKLLSKLLYYDSYTNPTIRTELRAKADSLLQYVTHIQE